MALLPVGMQPVGLLPAATCPAAYPEHHCISRRFHLPLPRRNTSCCHLMRWLSGRRTQRGEPNPQGWQGIGQAICWGSGRSNASYLLCRSWWWYAASSSERPPPCLCLPLTEDFTPFMPTIPLRLQLCSQRGCGDEPGCRHAPPLRRRAAGALRVCSLATVVANAVAQRDACPLKSHALARIDLSAGAPTRSPMLS